MIDIHCHILPDFDDGASNLEEALEMARMAYFSGVTDIIATPHFRGEPESVEKRQLINLRYRELAAALRQNEIPIRLYPGAEILCLPDTPELAAQRQLPTLSGTNYILTEFYFDESFAFMDGMLEELAGCGYRPVVAHPERYGAIQHDPYLLKRWSRLGYALQLNKGSILGAFGSRPEQAANEILAMGLADMFASDAHSCHSRTPHIGALLQWAEEFCDPRYTKILLEKNPLQLLLGRPMTGREDGF